MFWKLCIKFSATTFIEFLGIKELNSKALKLTYSFPCTVDIQIIWNIVFNIFINENKIYKVYIILSPTESYLPLI